MRTSMRVVFSAAIAGMVLSACSFPGASRAEDPPAINPFGSVKRDRDDAIPGYIEMSDGRVWVGTIYMTRDKRLKLEDVQRQVGTNDAAPSSDGASDENSEKRQREIPLCAVRQIEAQVEKEWMEKEWRFKEMAADEKYYTGRSYPARKYVYAVTLKDGRKLTGPLAEIIYIKPFLPTTGALPRDDSEPLRLMLHKRDKGEPGTTLKALTYVKRIKLGDDAVVEGKKKTKAKQKSKSQDAGNE